MKKILLAVLPICVLSFSLFAQTIELNNSNIHIYLAENIDTSNYYIVNTDTPAFEKLEQFIRKYNPIDTFGPEVKENYGTKIDELTNTIVNFVLQTEWEYYLENNMRKVHMYFYIKQK